MRSLVISFIMLTHFPRYFSAIFFVLAISIYVHEISRLNFINEEGKMYAKKTYVKQFMRYNSANELNERSFGLVHSHCRCRLKPMWRL